MRKSLLGLLGLPLLSCLSLMVQVGVIPAQRLSNAHSVLLRRQVKGRQATLCDAHSDTVGEAQYAWTRPTGAEHNQAATEQYSSTMRGY